MYAAEHINPVICPNPPRWCDSKRIREKSELQASVSPGRDQVAPKPRGHKREVVDVIVVLLITYIGRFKENK